jgi:7-cyano-7-deazaguanine synthase
VLLSGGIDSVTLLHYIAGRLRVPTVYTLSLAYGQKHSRELEMARWQARAVGVAGHSAIDISFFAPLIAGASALTDTGREVPDLAQLDGEARRQPPTYVPHRNLLFLALAAARAEAVGAGDVFYGAQLHDEVGYWDCTAEFVDRLNSLLNLNRRRPVSVHAPFSGRTKSEVVKIGLALGVDYSHTWTCYRGEDRPCGSCPSCVERSAAFRARGAPDPLEEE